MYDEPAGDIWYHGVSELDLHGTVDVMSEVIDQATGEATQVITTQRFQSTPANWTYRAEVFGLDNGDYVRGRCPRGLSGSPIFRCHHSLLLLHEPTDMACGAVCNPPENLIEVSPATVGHA